MSNQSRNSDLAADNIQQLISDNDEIVPKSQEVIKSSNRGKIEPKDMAVREQLLRMPSQFWNRNLEDLSFTDRAKFAVLKTIAGTICDCITQVLNETHIHNHNTFLNLLDKEDRNGKPLLTVSNHLHLLDDPLIHAALLKGSYLNSYRILWGDNTELENWKWTPAEQRNFFQAKNPIIQSLKQDFFGTMMTVPVLRGSGINQGAFVSIAEKLRKGYWAHIFPEGGRIRKYPHIDKFKEGVGYLIKQVPNTIIMPVAHDGLQYVSPKLCGPVFTNPRTKEPEKSLLRTNQRIQINVGEPFTLEEFANNVPDNKEGYQLIADEIRERLEPYYFEAIKMNQEAIAARRASKSPLRLIK